MIIFCRLVDLRGSNASRNARQILLTFDIVIGCVRLDFVAGAGLMVAGLS